MPLMYQSRRSAAQRRGRSCCAFEPLDVRQLFAAVFPTAHEQYFLELTNRARATPVDEAARFGIDLNEGLSAGTISANPKQPLALNPYLIDAARDHSAWMLDTDTFSHSGAGGSGPGDRMEAAGYVFTGSSTWGENLAWSGTTGTVNATVTVERLHRNLFVDEGIAGRGHRTNMLSGSFREAGSGVEIGLFTTGTGDYNAVMAAMDFARSGSDLFLTGVAYTDAITDDDFYTPAEGMSGVVVTATNDDTDDVYTTTTWDSGGYSLAVPAGTYTVVASGGGLGGNVRHTNVIVSTQNIKRDFTPDLVASDFATLDADGVLQIDGTADADLITITLSNGAINASRNGVSIAYSQSLVHQIRVFPDDGDDYVSVGPGVMGIYVSAGGGDDLLYGGDGKDSLTGGAGKDRIYAGEGEDRLNGGGGHDRIFGELDKDRIYGGSGNDWIEGGAHLDRMWGESGFDSLFGQSGRDTFYVADGGYDYIAGGSDSDSAYTDVEDELASIENLLA